MVQTPRKKSARKTATKKRATKKRATKKPVAKAPWKHPPKKKHAAKKLGPQQKERAKARAKRAGRPYPNLVDNMREASSARAGKTARKTRKKSASSK